ncbi:MAG: hypothetical protein PVSMB4_09800 [Ktedonobacterales bacterium]
MATETTPESRAELVRAPAARPPFWRRVPLYAYAGALLNALAWISSWGRIGPWPYTFFFLWLGFILALDGLNVARSGTSLLTRGLGRFVLLFVYSSPFWWIFEALNIPVQNWHYRFDHPYAPLAYVAITSLDFSTVLPAALEMFELFATIAVLRPRLAPPSVGPRLPRWLALLLVALGGAMLWLPFVYPTYAFGLVWLCLILLLDPLTNLAGRKSAFGHLLAGDWRFFVTLPLATLCCGFFWELWNSRALPGWYYTVPLVDRAPHLFAMPLPGYLGYLPFGVELFVMYQFALLLTRQRDDGLTV